MRKKTEKCLVVSGKIRNFALDINYNACIMKKKLLIFSTVSLLMLGTPAMAGHMVMEMGVAEQIDEQTPTISVNNNVVNIQGGNGMTLEVVSLTGRAVASYIIESPSQRIDLNLPKGCYILKIGKVVRKVTVR